jgi:predicted DNA-binding transcriptional regulator AlpA
MSADDILFATFWAAPADALFASPTIAKVRSVAVATLERERSMKAGPKYCKVGGRVLYRKADVLAWIQQQTTECA